MKVWLDGFVLLVKVRQVGDEILDNVCVRERVDARLLSSVGRDAAQAGQCVDAVNVHGTAAADALSAASSECKGRVHLVLDPDQCIKHHRAGLVQIDRVCLHPRLGCRLIWVPAVDVESLEFGILVRSRILDIAGLALGRDRSVRRRDLGGGGHCPAEHRWCRSWGRKARRSDSERRHCGLERR